ncbi:hypothetical protein OAO03_02080 [Candidatus Pelagibacter ubique]|nr:hypothetical protein [Candidatus Pelagibacter ubique]
MAIFDKIAVKRNNFLGYQGEAPTNETEYNAVKDVMFSETAPTWTEIKSEIDAYVDPRVSAKAKLIAGEALTEEEANTIVI